MIQPLHNYVFIRLRDAAKESRGGIIIPDKLQEKPCHGTVVAVGFGRLLKKGGGKRAPAPVAPGDTVVTTKLGWTPMKVNGEELMMGNWDDILAVEA